MSAFPYLTWWQGRLGNLCGMLSPGQNYLPAIREKSLKLFDITWRQLLEKWDYIYTNPRRGEKSVKGRKYKIFGLHYIIEYPPPPCLARVFCKIYCMWGWSMHSYLYTVIPIQSDTLSTYIFIYIFLIT